MINAKSGLYSFIFSLMLGVAPAWADVDISSMNKVEVGSWAELKAAVENSANSGKVIVLKDNIIADVNDPIETIANNLIIDGGGHTISGHEDGGSFLVYNGDDPNLIIQNVTFSGFKGMDVNFSIGAIANNGYIKDITADFIGNSTSGIATVPDANGISTYSAGTHSSFSAAAGSAIYNEGTIENVTGVFRGNFAQSTSGAGFSVYGIEPPPLYNAAQGGAIYNGGSITLVKPIVSIAVPEMISHALGKSICAML